MKWAIKQSRCFKNVTLVMMCWQLFSGCDLVARIPEVRITNKDGNMIQVQVEVARTPGERNLGLMYRTSLGKNKGMLFIFDDERRQTFTMKNTPIPLDMIFIGRDMRIVGIVEHAVPFSQKQYSIEKPSQYVLEVNAFFCRDHNIKIGDDVLFKNIQ